MNFSKIKSWIKNAKKICLIHHIDTDGICSGFLIAKAIELMNGDIPYLFSYTSGSIQKKVYDKLVREKFDLVIVTDIAVDSDPKYVKLLSDAAKVILFDHHELTNDLNSKRILHFSTKMETGKYYPCSFYVYNIFSEFMDLSKYDWVAAIGLIGDYGASKYPKFMDSVLKKYNMSSKDPNYYDTSLGEIDKILGSARVYNGKKGALKAIKILLQCETLEDFNIKNRVLKNWKEKVQKSLDQGIKEFEDKAERFDDTFLYVIEKPRYNVGGPMSTILGHKYKDKTITLIIKIDKTRAKIHVRRNDGKFNTYKLLKKGLKGFENSKFGGHIPASGGEVLIKDISKFRERIRDIVKAKCF